MFDKHRARTVILTALPIIASLFTFIAAPLWLDALGLHSQPRVNVTTWTNSSNFTPPIHVFNSSSMVISVDPYFIVLAHAFLTTVIFGIILLGILIFAPGQIGNTERNYSKGILFATGGGQAVAAILTMYALSGTRTAPYLIAILGNLHVPVQFSVRWVMFT